jgi:hypothetical protein
MILDLSDQKFIPQVWYSAEAPLSSEPSGVEASDQASSSQCQKNDGKEMGNVQNPLLMMGDCTLPHICQWSQSMNGESRSQTIAVPEIYRSRCLRCDTEASATQKCPTTCSSDGFCEKQACLCMCSGIFNICIARYDMIRYDKIWYDMILWDKNMIWYYMIQDYMVRYYVICCYMLFHDVIWCDMKWYDVKPNHI